MQTPDVPLGASLSTPGACTHPPVNAKDRRTSADTGSLSTVECARNGTERRPPEAKHEEPAGVSVADRSSGRSRCARRGTPRAAKTARTRAPSKTPSDYYALCLLNAR